MQAKLLELPHALLEDILCRLPRKSLGRLKCVSKELCYLISHGGHVIPKTTNYRLGFLCKRYCPGDRYKQYFLQTSLHLDYEGGASIDNCVDFQLESTWIIFASCNGLLLLCDRNEVSSLQTVKEAPEYSVYNPATNLLECLVPPNPLCSHHAALGFDGNHFIVVFFSRSSDLSRLVFNVYSSKDEMWKMKKLDSPFSCDFDFPILDHVASLFFKGAIHWQLKDQLLIYHLQDEFCKVIKLPDVDGQAFNDDLGSHVWQFEGCLHFCRVWDNKINIWVLQMEGQNYIPGEQRFNWQDKHSGVLEPPTSNLVPECCSCLGPFAFNEDFEILYIVRGKNVISYHQRTGIQKVVHTFLQELESCCFYHSFGYPPFSYMCE